MSERLRILVLMGGTSSEHSVSLVSGSGVVQNLSEEHYEVIPVIIEKDGTWRWSVNPLNHSEKANFSGESKDSFANEYSAIRPALNELPKADCAFIALHGTFGEDGQIQALLDYWNIPYTGSSMSGASLAMNKIRSKEVCAYFGIKTPKWVSLNRSEISFSKIQELGTLLGYPLVIKDPVGGSSLGMGIAQNADSAFQLAEELSKGASELLVESFAKGRETTCAYLEGVGSLPPTEIVPDADQEYFDFEAKYRGKSQEITPADFPVEITEELQSLAKRCHHALGLSVYSRSDFLLQGEELLYLETNTLPGLTPQSLLPQAAAARGIDYPELLHRIIQSSLRNFS